MSVMSSQPTYIHGSSFLPSSSAGPKLTAIIGCIYSFLRRCAVTESSSSKPLEKTSEGRITTLLLLPQQQLDVQKCSPFLPQFSISFTEI
jgi:hypothetical protein